MEWPDLSPGQVSLEEDRTFYHKVPIKLYGNSNFNFLINVLSTSKRSYDGLNLGKRSSSVF